MGEPAGRPVQVAVDAIADRPERTFTYLLPSALGEVDPGSLLLVPYGRREALGYLVPGEPAPDGDLGGLKQVEAVVSGPMLTPDLLALAEEIAVYYRAPIGTTLAAMLPPGLESRIERRWALAADELPAELSGLRDAVADDGLVADAAVLRRAPRRGVDAWLARHRRSGALRATWSLRP
ncbi:MAG TPA: hypothetical protein VF013_03465, partial [Candidatus Limnocylindria bacterium]